VTHKRWLMTLAVAAILFGALGGVAWATATPANDELVGSELPDHGMSDPSLSGVSCVSSSFCVAVGQYGSGFSVGDFVERWNGRSWRLVSRRQFGGNTALYGVSCLSRSFCLAVGAVSTDTLGERWNGRSWSKVKTVSPPGPGYDILSSVACVRRTDCWAVGATKAAVSTRRDTLIEHWNGRAWRRFSAPVANGGLQSVSCSSPSNCWAVGNGWMNGSGGTAVEHFDGRSWRVGKLPTAPDQYAPIAVSCRTLAACWIVTSKRQNPIALRLQAGAWQVVSMANPGYQGRPSGQTLNAIDCASASDCWAVGYGPGRPPLPSQFPFAEQWDGSSWHIATVTAPPGIHDYADAFNAASCTVAQCVAVGAFGGSRTNPLVAVAEPLS
jgi:hypothetical protein